jgi:hypothetical protein
MDAEHQGLFDRKAVRRADGRAVQNQALTGWHPAWLIKTLLTSRFSPKSRSQKDGQLIP